ILALFGGRATRGIHAVESLARTSSRPLRVLVAEDTAVNRQFVTRVLEKRGHAVVTVVNGQEAIDAIAGAPAHRFDVVLMDVQMPEVAGAPAPVVIRQRERSSGRGGHVPIVAMTAHAMTGDRERCLAAGMDGYVSKPLHPQELIDAVERALDSAQARVVEPSAAKAAATPAGVDARLAFDVDDALGRLGGDRRLLRELIAIFRPDAPAQLDAIRPAVARRDPEALRRAAHALKGSLGTLHAPRAYDAAARLEDLARRNDSSAVPAAVAAVERELTDLARALAPARRK